MIKFLPVENQKKKNQITGSCRCQGGKLKASLRHMFLGECFQYLSEAEDRRINEQVTVVCIDDWTLNSSIVKRIN